MNMYRITKFFFLILALSPLFLWSASTEIELENNLARIERNIQQLKVQLHQEGILKERAEEKMQEFMINGNWRDYQAVLEEVRHLTEESDAITTKIRALENQKYRILERRTSSQNPRL